MVGIQIPSLNSFTYISSTVYNNKGTCQKVIQGMRQPHDVIKLLNMRDIADIYAGRQKFESFTCLCSLAYCVAETRTLNRDMKER